MAIFGSTSQLIWPRSVLRSSTDPPPPILHVLGVSKPSLWVGDAALMRAAFHAAGAMQRTAALHVAAPIAAPAVPAAAREAKDIGWMIHGETRARMDLVELVTQDKGSGAMGVETDSSIS